MFVVVLYSVSILSISMLCCYFYSFSSRCRFRVSSDSVSCCNQNCPSLHTGEFSSQLTLDISLSLSDHSGTIHFVRLSGETANDLLTTTVILHVYTLYSNFMHFIHITMGDNSSILDFSLRSWGLGYGYQYNHVMGSHLQYMYMYNWNCR